MARKKGLSHKYLLSLFRKACLIKFQRCILCGETDPDKLEIHHICKVRHRVLAYNWRNGTPVCKANFGDKSCHTKIDSTTGILLLNELRPLDMEHIAKYENMTLPEYCSKRGITKDEFFQEKKDELLKVLKGV